MRVELSFAPLWRGPVLRLQPGTGQGSGAGDTGARDLAKRRIRQGTGLDNGPATQDEVLIRR
jgi:hypothetical protein